MLNDILDEIRLQIEDPEVGIKSLLFDNIPNGLKRKEEKYLQRLIANLIKDKLKQLKIFPAREVELENATKPDIYIPFDNFRIPIEIKWSDNNSQQRGLFTGIINELVEKYMQKANYGFYIIGLLYNDDESINLIPKTKDSILNKFSDNDLKSHLEEFFNKNQISQITSEKQLIDLLDVISAHIKEKYNKTVAFKIIKLVI